MLNPILNRCDIALIFPLGIDGKQDCPYRGRPELGNGTDQGDSLPMMKAETKGTMITDPIQTRRAWLAWQSSRGDDTRYRVAELVQVETGVTFRYLDEAELAAARSSGFRHYVGLPAEREQDPARVIDTLIRRLPPRTRPDFPEMMRRFGLDPSAEFTDLSLLAYMGARSAADTFGVTESFDGFDRPFRFVFDIAGYRHYRDDVGDLEAGERVIFRPDPQNEFDPNAVELVRETGARAGWLNRLQTGPMRRWLAEGRVDACVFRINGRATYPRLFVMADIDPAHGAQFAPDPVCDARLVAA